MYSRRLMKGVLEVAKTMCGCHEYQYLRRHENSRKPSLETNFKEIRRTA